MTVFYISGIKRLQEEMQLVPLSFEALELPQTSDLFYMRGQKTKTGRLKDIYEVTSSVFNNHQACTQ